MCCAYGYCSLLKNDNAVDFVSDGPSKGAGRLRQKRPTSKRRRPMLRPTHKTRGHNRLSPKNIQALSAKTNSSKERGHSSKPRQNTRPAVKETKTTTAITNQNQRENKMAAEKMNRAIRVKMEPTAVQGLTSRPVQISRSRHVPLLRSRSLPVPNQPAAVPRRSMAVPERTLIGPERKPLACYQLERDQLRLLLVAWMKSQADQKGLCNITDQFANVTINKIKHEPCPCICIEASLSIGKHFLVTDCKVCYPLLIVRVSTQ